MKVYCKNIIENGLQTLDAGAFQAVVQSHANAFIRNRIDENQVVFGLVEVVHEGVKF